MCVAQKKKKRGGKKKRNGQVAASRAETGKKPPARLNEERVEPQGKR